MGNGLYGKPSRNLQNGRISRIDIDQATKIGGRHSIFLKVANQTDSSFHLQALQ